MTLNWRHKTGLLLALTATGLSLFFELSVKQTAGIAVLGFSLAWFAGSVPPPILGWLSAVLCCFFGLYVGLAPLGHDWMLFQKAAAEYDSAMAALHAAVRNVLPKSIDHPEPLPVLPPGYTLDTRDIHVEVPASVQVWERSDFDVSEKQVVSFPGNASEKEIIDVFQTQMLRPRPRFVLAVAIKVHVLRLLGGTLLFALGLTGAWLLTRAHSKGREQSRAV